MTAVELLEIEIKKQISQCKTQWECGYQNALNEVFFLLKQTKEMEKQQIIEAYDEAEGKIIGRGESYYNETFNTKEKMKIKWSEVMKAAKQSYFTDEEYGLIYRRSKLDVTIGVEEYATGEKIKSLLEAIGFEVEVDVTFQDEDEIWI
jgi:hypothetical protein